MNRMNVMRKARSVVTRLIHRRGHKPAPPHHCHYHHASSSRVAPPQPPSRPPATSVVISSTVAARPRPGPGRRRLRKLDSAIAGATYLVEAVPFTNRRRLLVPRKLERLIGDVFVECVKQELGADKILPPDHPDTVRVRRIASEIVRAGASSSSRRRRRDTLGSMEVMVVENDGQFNAMSVPGKIVVYTGLLHKLGGDAEIAAVIAHEVGHIIARHSSEILTKIMLRFIRHVVTLQFMYRPPPSPKTAVPLPLRRRMELEADHIGLLVLAAAGYDPRAFLLFFEKHAKIMDDPSDTEDDDNNYHPSNRERIQFISQDDIMNRALELYAATIWAD